MTPDDDATPEERRALFRVVHGEPTDAERSRTLLGAVRTAALATLGDGGFPFGSLVSHAVDAAGLGQGALEDLVTTAPPKNRETEAEKARARARLRYGT